MAVGRRGFEQGLRVSVVDRKETGLKTCIMLALAAPLFFPQLPTISSRKGKVYIKRSKRQDSSFVVCGTKKARKYNTRMWVVSRATKDFSPRANIRCKTLAMFLAPVHNHMHQPLCTC